MEESPRSTAVILAAAGTGAGAVTVPKPGAGIGDAGWELNEDVGIGMHREIAVAMGGLAGACRTVAGGTAEAPVIIAVLPLHVRECRQGQPVRSAAV